MDDEVEAAVVNLARWAGVAKTAAAIEERRRGELLARRAEEEATLADAVATLAERRAVVSLRTRAGATHRGTVVGAGVDYVALVNDRHLTLISLSAFESIRPEESAAPAASTGQATPTSRLATVLTGLADDGAEVRLVTASEAIAAEIVAVGEDVLTARSPGDARRGRVFYVPMAAIYEASLRLSG